jgi:gas vesicle protein
MKEDSTDRRDNGFLVGLLMGTAVGAGLALWFTPRAGSEMRQRVSDSTRELGNRASERYQQVSTRVSQAVDDLASKGEGVRNDLADRVVRGAQEVERIATAARSRGSETRKQAAADKTGTKPQS